jgi:hypothetical protein
MIEYRLTEDDLVDAGWLHSSKKFRLQMLLMTIDIFLLLPI